MVRKRASMLSTVSVSAIDDSGGLHNESHPKHDTSVSADLSAGDIDARWDQAESSGEETVAGSAPTPDQDIVDEIGHAIGITYKDGEPLRVGRKEEERDEHRWELDPASAEDYGNRSAPTGAERILRMKHRDRYRR